MIIKQFIITDFEDVKVYPVSIFVNSKRQPQLQFQCVDPINDDSTATVPDIWFPVLAILLLLKWSPYFLICFYGAKRTLMTYLKAG